MKSKHENTLIANQLVVNLPRKCDHCIIKNGNLFLYNHQSELRIIEIYRKTTGWNKKLLQLKEKKSNGH